MNFIEKDTALSKGNYIIENNIKIAKGATLTAEGGSKFLFRKGASVKVEGGLVFSGRTNSFIDITSESSWEEGLGFIISGANTNAEIIMEYAQFSYLLVPLNFEKNWSRKRITIENNIFKNISTGEPGISIRNPDEIITKGPIPFSFSYNNFTGNNSSIFIENPESDVLKMRFRYNLVTSNYFFGFETGGGLNAPVTVLFDNNKLKYNTDFKGNSFFNNFLLNDTSGEIIREVDFGIRGRGESFSLDSNYFGNKTEFELKNSFDHSYNYKDAPYISVNKPLPVPSDSTHGHIWKILFNGEELNSPDIFPELKDQALEIAVTYNRNLFVRGGVQFLSYTYYDESTKKLFSKNVTCTYKIDKAVKIFRLIAKDNIYLKNTRGYFTIAGLNDDDGFALPPVTIGKENLKEYFLMNNIPVRVE